MKEDKELFTGESMEARLWDYIDGNAAVAERSAIEKLIESNTAWREKYNELLELHQALLSAEAQAPSMRFAKNVMEEISKYQITPAAKTYINKKIIWGIGLFFIIMIIAFLVYSFGQIDWRASGGNNLPIDFSKIDYSKFFSNTYINIFMMMNVVFGLMLLDRFLANKKKSLHKKA